MIPHISNTTHCTAPHKATRGRLGCAGENHAWPGVSNWYGTQRKQTAKYRITHPIFGTLYFLIASAKASIASMSRWLVGSSRSSRLGLPMHITANMRRDFCPSESSLILVVCMLPVRIWQCANHLACSEQHRTLKKSPSSCILCVSPCVIDEWCQDGISR